MVEWGHGSIVALNIASDDSVAAGGVAVGIRRMLRFVLANVTAVGAVATAFTPATRLVPSSFYFKSSSWQPAREPARDVARQYWRRIPTTPTDDVTSATGPGGLSRRARRHPPGPWAGRVGSHLRHRARPPQQAGPVATRPGPAGSRGGLV